jgi:FlaA1/EpsC-like NDP-sugar epimerase
MDVDSESVQAVSTIEGEMSKGRRITNALLSWHPRAKLAVAVTVDAAVAMAAYGGAALLTHPDSPVIGVRAIELALCPLPVAVALYLVGAYKTVIRFIGVSSIRRLMSGYILAATLIALFSRGVSTATGQWSTLIVFAMLGGLASTGLRIIASRILRPGASASERTNVLIYGAGRAGVQLASALQVSGRFHPIAFVDDNPHLHGRTVMGLRVEAPAKLAAMRAQKRFDQVLLAIPSASRSRRREILETLVDMAVRVQVVPALEEVAGGVRRIDDVREVQVEDLLGRDPVAPIQSLTEAYIRGKRVLVTGAGGSIGAELCRQIARLGVKRLLLFDVSEYALYAIDREIRTVNEGCGFELIPVLGSVTDTRHLERIISSYEVETVYHAAAYKHVPLVEYNVCPAVHNNVFGTLHAVSAAMQGGARNFVLVSTDKAVRPTSVMGASKRLCELIVQAYAQSEPSMRMSIVRFGNVLASSGSVVPLFLSQIRAGGPVTVTHPEVSRYFMTIPEAAQLVLQAGAMGSDGEVFVLDMGQAVRIRDLAERMIKLCGRDGDIPIRYTGLRPGEKLHEELLLNNAALPTIHPRIFVAREKSISRLHLGRLLTNLESALADDDEQRVRGCMSTVVDGFGDQVGERWAQSSTDLLSTEGNEQLQSERRAPADPVGGVGTS